MTNFDDLQEENNEIQEIVKFNFEDVPEQGLIKTENKEAKKLRLSVPGIILGILGATGMTLALLYTIHLPLGVERIIPAIETLINVGTMAAGVKLSGKKLTHEELEEIEKKQQEKQAKKQQFEAEKQAKKIEKEVKRQERDAEKQKIRDELAKLKSEAAEKKVQEKFAKQQKREAKRQAKLNKKNEEENE